MVQRTQIEEDLFEIRLRRRCFAALAVASPQSTVLSPQSNFPAEGSDSGRAKMTVPGFLSIPGLADPAVTSPPVSLSEGPRRAPVPTLDLDGAAPHLAPGEHDAFPKGRWAKGEWKPW